MEAGGDKNKEFLRWIRCLPKERRKDELQRIVSGGVLRGTSAKSALFKLQRRCFVKLRRLDIVRGMVAGATACPSPPVSAPVVAAPTAALPTSPSNPPCPPSCSPSPSSPPLKPKRLLGASRPCPLSRKRPSDTIREEDSKRSRISCDERQNIDPQACPQQTEPSSPAALSDQLKVSSDSPQSKDECSSDLPETEESASSGRRNPKEPLSGHTKSNEAQSAGLTLSPIRQSSHVPQSKNPQSIPPKSAPAPSEPSKPLPKNRLTASQPPLPHQRAQFSSRVVDEALKDVAKSIYDVETELFNIDQKLFSFDKLPPTHKTSRTLSALYETSKVISLKAGSIKSCIALGIAEFLGHSFYPKLLSEIIKIPKLKLYSSLRLTTMVNLLLHLSDPNTDPKYMVNAFMALNMNEWRPAENNKASKPPKRPAPNGSTLQASQLHVTLTQVSSVSQAINLPAYTEVVSHPPQSVEVTPQKPQQPELFMSQAPPPQNTLVQQQLEQQRQHELYLQQLERERQERERQERERQEQERQRQAQLQQQQYFQQQQQYQRQLQHQRMREYNQAMRQQQTTFQQNPVQQQPRTYPQHPAQNPSVSAAKSSRAAQRQQSTQNVQLPAANSMQGASNQSYQYPVPRGSRVPLPVMSTTDINLRTLLHSSSGPNVYYSSQTSNQMKTNNTQMYDSQVQVVHQAQHTTAVSLSQGPVAGQQQVSQGQHQVLQGQHYVPQMNPTYAQSALGSTAAYNPSNYQPIQSQQGFPVDNTAETTPYVYMTGQELMPGGIQFMNQVSPVARTVSRDSGIATPEPAPQQYDDAYLRTAVTAAAWKPNFS